MTKVKTAPKKRFRLTMALTCNGVDRRASTEITGTSFTAAMDDYDAMDAIEAQLGYTSESPPEGLTKLTFTLEKL